MEITRDFVAITLTISMMRCKMKIVCFVLLCVDSITEAEFICILQNKVRNLTT